MKRPVVPALVAIGARRLPRCRCSDVCQLETRPAHGGHESSPQLAGGAERRPRLSRAATSRRAQAQIVGVTQQPFVGISLQDAIAMALLKNPNLAVSASNLRIARYTIVEAKGAYDVQLQLKPSSSFSVNPPQNAFEAGPGRAGKVLARARTRRRA